MTHIESALEALRAEHRELMVKSRAINQRLSAVQEAIERLTTIDEMDYPLRKADDSDTSPTIKERITNILRRSPRGMTSNSLLEQFNRDGGDHIRRSSFSPQLSRLKRDGYVVFDDLTKRYSLAVRPFEPVDESELSPAEADAQYEFEKGEDD